MIDVLIKALRNKAAELNQTADSLQKLGFMLGPLFVDDNSNKRKASRAIIERINKIKTAEKFVEQWTEPVVEVKKVNPNKGYKYPAGQHWTQKPENVNKLKKVVKRLQKARKETGKFNQHTK